MCVCVCVCVSNLVLGHHSRLLWIQMSSRSVHPVKSHSPALAPCIDIMNTTVTHLLLYMQITSISLIIKHTSKDDFPQCVTLISINANKGNRKSDNDELIMHKALPMIKAKRSLRLQLLVLRVSNSSSYQVLYTVHSMKIIFCFD